MAILIRPLDAGDHERVAALVARLSPESRHRRFLTPKPELSSRELKHLTDVDHVTHEALAAIDLADGSIVGIARYAQPAGLPGVGDFAIEVADELQRRRIGTVLSLLLVCRARANGFHLLTATTLWENRPARALLRRLGFQARTSSGSEIELELEVESAAHPASLAEQGLGAWPWP